MIEYLNFIRPEKFAIIKYKKSNIIIFKNFNLKNKIIFFNKKFKYINHSEEDSFLLSNDKFFIEISKSFKWYRFINKFGICEKKINTFFKFEIEDIKINIKTNEIIILDNKSNICFFDYTNNQIILKKKLNLPIKFNTAKFDFIDYKKIFICIDNRKIIFLENLKDIKFLNIFKNARNITSLRIFNKKIILVDQRNYCLHIFNLEGKQQKKIGSKGTSIRNFDLPSEINMFGNKLLISDQNNDRFLIIDKNFKLKIFKKRIITKSSLSRPIKSLIINKFIYILDRENCRIQIYSLKLDLVKSHNLVKIENAKPNSFCFNSKLNCFFILYRKSNLTNVLVCYNEKFRKTFKKQISTNDAQDISCSIDYLFLANTLGRSLDKYDLNLNFIKKIKLNNLSLNSRVLLKTVCVDKFERIYTATFDDFKIFKFDINLNLLKKINLNKYASKLKVIRSVIINKDNSDIIYLLNRGKKPIWTYSIKKNQVIKKFNIVKNGFSLRNPTSISMFENNLIICDKENDRIIKKKISYFQ